MRQLASRLTFPNSHDSDNHLFEKGEYTPVTQISTDMLAAYPEAADQFFGPYARYGQLRKEYRNATMPYTPSEMVGTDRKGIFGINPDKLWSICTSHVERHNLTIRTLMKRLTRLNLGFSKKLDNLPAACQVFLAYYNSVWRTRFDDKSGMRGQILYSGPSTGWPTTLGYVRPEAECARGNTRTVSTNRDPSTGTADLLADAAIGKYRRQICDHSLGQSSQQQSHTDDLLHLT